MKTTLKTLGTVWMGLTAVVCFVLAGCYAWTSYDVIGIAVLVSAGIACTRTTADILDA